MTSSITKSVNGSCLQGGDWYECLTTPPYFFGCCNLNPCLSSPTSSGCPVSALHPASLGLYGGSEYPNVNCSLGTWFTCSEQTPSFQGCCERNPCGGDGSTCVEGLLFPAGFAVVSGTVTSTAKSVTSTAKMTVVASSIGLSTAVSTTSSIATASNSGGAETAHPTNTPLIIGSAIGATAGVLIMLFAFLYFLRRHSERKLHSRIQNSIVTPTQVQVVPHGVDDMAEVEGCPGPYTDPSAGRSEKNTNSKELPSPDPTLFLSPNPDMPDPERYSKLTPGPPGYVSPLISEVEGEIPRQNNSRVGEMGEGEGVVYEMDHTSTPQIAQDMILDGRRSRPITGLGLGLGMGFGGVSEGPVRDHW